MREREDSNEEMRGFTVLEIENGFRVCNSQGFWFRKTIT
jgi:hypothetical protein